MPSVCNRSRFCIKVKNRDDLTRYFPYNQTKAVEQYVADLKAQGFKPAISRTDDAFEVRIRQTGFADQNVTFTSAADAEQFINTVTAERERGLFIDYTGAWKTTFADLIARYIREEAPKHKSFEMEAYKLNGLLEDAGCARVNLEELAASHPRLKGKKLRQPNGAKMRESASTVEWIKKPFAQIEPTDFEDYVNERLEVVAPATVDRELDLFSAICRIAINTWRIAVPKSPMDGVRRPRYFNERDRRLRPGEEMRLLEAANAEDRERSIAQRLEELLADARDKASGKSTVYGRKNIIKTARAAFAAEAEQSYTHIPLVETFVQFQLMTAARRSETLGLTWQHIDFEQRTAYLPETKNGRPRKLPLRQELMDLLLQLPQDDERVFPLSMEGLRKVWRRMCEAARLDDLHIHDLRHEAISRVAETGEFSLVDLQAFSGHRDVRMLLRYAHLCARQLADRLDQAFQKGSAHKGRKRMASSGNLPLGEIVAATTTPLLAEAPASTQPEPANHLILVPEPSLGANVIRFPGRGVA